MNNAVSVNKQATGKSYYLSELLGARVVRAGKKVGRLSDLVIIDGNLVAEVSHLYVTRPFGEPALLVPWDKVRLMSNKEIVIDIESPEKYAVVNGHKLLLLKDDVVNKKVLDTEGKEVDVVYDVKLVIIDNRLYVSEVDMSRYGLLRSLGLRWLADLIYNLANKIKHETVPWAYVQPLPSDIGSFSGDLRLRVLKEKLSEMHPVDLADILTEMDPEQRLAVFDQNFGDGAAFIRFDLIENFHRFNYTQSVASLDA